MLYFRFNTDDFIAPKRTNLVVDYKDGKPISEPYTEIESVCLGDIEEYFFNKLRVELGLHGIGIGEVLYDVLGVPIDSFSVNDELIGNCDGVLKYVLSEYTKLPIMELENKSLQDLGIKIEFCKRMTNYQGDLQIKQYMQRNKLSYVEEEVLWKYLSNDEKIKKFSSYFPEIQSDGKELIIVDPYLLKDESDEYCDMLATIINNANAEFVVIITEERNFKELCLHKISEKIDKQIVVKYSNDFHDRFWIADRKKGFVTGTSLNGVGKRISLIYLLEDDDVESIIEELTRQNILA